MENIFEGKKLEFIAPSGYSYTIREQNGADDDILSNPVEALTLRNISAFISAIVVNTDYTSNGKLTIDQAHGLPSLDRYCILLNSRIFSISEDLEFEHDWGKDMGGIVNYSQNLNDYLFDYSKEPTEEDLEQKPNAIPYYPNGKQVTDIPISTSSGKDLKFDCLTAFGESMVLNLPKEKRTKNQELIARNIRLKVGEKYEKITSFHLFSVKDMMEIRKAVFELDPIFEGICELKNPYDPNIKDVVSIVAIKDFFYPGEI